jgi:hypothetical protein
MVKWFLFFLLLVSCCWAAAQAPKDTLYFMNGTKVIGEIKSIKLGVITFDPDDANDITVQLRKLKSIAAVRTVFRIETTGQRVFYGQLKPHPIDQFARLIQGTDSSSILIEDITLLYPFKKAFIGRFSGNVGIGFSYTRSSDFGQLNFNGKVAYTDRREQLTLSTSGIYSITDTTFSRDREDVTLKNNYYFSPTWFASAFLTYQRNLELGLDRRYLEGAGIGNKYLTTKHFYGWVMSGFVFNQEKNTEGEQTGTLKELFAQFQFNYFKFTKPEIHFLISQTFYYSLSQAGRFRNDGETNLSWEIIKDFDLTFTFYNNFDNQPPTAGSRKFDFGIVFGLNYTFD